MTSEFVVRSEAAWTDVARVAAKRVNSGVLALYGSMGAGKTTFTRYFCQEKGVKDEVSSPTFSLIQEYRTSTDAPIYHFDFYRITSPEEAIDIGAEEYFYSEAICLIEWPERVDELLPKDRFNLHIQFDGLLRHASLYSA